MRNKIRYIRLIGLIFVLIVGSSLTFAQNKSKRKSAKKPLVEVVSIVTDEKGSPLKNVSIICGRLHGMQHALDHLAEGRTTLIIAHRLSTIRSASRILVVADGRICEQGTHEELMRLGGLYATLRSTQDLSSAE